MKRWFSFCVVLCLAAAIAMFLIDGHHCWAGGTSIVDVLKKIEGRWKVTNETERGGIVEKEIDFKLNPDVLIVSLIIKGVEPYVTNISLGDLSINGGEIKFKIKFPPYLKPAEIKVNSSGTIKGEVARGGMTPGFVSISFSKL